MSDAHDSATEGAAHAEPTAHAEPAAHGPTIPEVVDEAGDSPAWLPWLGVALFCLAAVLIAGRNAAFEPATQGGADEQVEGDGADPAEVEPSADAPEAAEGH
jgi:hypothetical protein